MSEYPTFNLALGIIGTITGAIALVVSYVMYRREKPKLKLKIEKCEHEYVTSKSNFKTLSFYVSFEVRNLGDRGTSINDVGLSFLKKGKKTFEIKKTTFRPYAERIWLNAHDTVNFAVNFGITAGGELGRIDCLFTIYQTHGNDTIKCTSVRKPPKPLMEKLYE